MFDSSLRERGGVASLRYKIRPFFCVISSSIRYGFRGSANWAFWDSVNIALVVDTFWRTPLFRSGVTADKESTVVTRGGT